MAAELSKIRDSNLENRLSRLAVAMRAKTLKKATSKAIKPVTKAIKSMVPRGGPRTGVKSGKKHLQQTITDKTMEINAGQGALSVAGARYPEGAHFHLVDRGFTHVSGAQVPGKKIILRAVSQSRSDSNAAFENHISEAIKNA